MKTLLLVGTLLWCGCGVRMLPSRAIPRRVLPPSVVEPASSPPPGHGRVLVDVTDGPTDVEEVVARGKVAQKRTVLVGGVPHASTTMEDMEMTKRLCQTPCYLDLPYGRHDLKFVLRSDGKTDSAIVSFEKQPTAYRRSLGFFDRKVGTRWGGFILTITGGAFVASGGLVAGIEAGDLGGKNKSYGVPIGFIVTGAVVAGVGIYLLIRSRPVKQDGVAVQWPLQEPRPR